MLADTIDAANTSCANRRVDRQKTTTVERFVGVKVARHLPHERRRGGRIGRRRNPRRQSLS